ncbi:hypothetical protein TNCV_5111291 [Trichonephila clavipes]|nr:hypothetical protein TNCV_5111291 [Trichonephila clavipes]
MAYGCYKNNDLGLNVLCLDYLFEEIIGCLRLEDVADSKSYVQRRLRRLVERFRIDSSQDEEMIICEDWKVLEKEAHVDNLRATSTWTEISKEGFQKECMQLINKVSPEQYDNILTLKK